LNRERQDSHPIAVNKNRSYTRRYCHRSDHDILRRLFIRSGNETLSIATRVGSRSFARRSPSLPRNPMSVLNREP
jgi:hypothetical protein